MSKIKAVGIGRTSSEDNSGFKVSVDVQKQDFEEACKTHGWENLGFYEDRDFSGRTYPICGKTVYELDTVTQDYLKNKNTTKLFRKGLSCAIESGASILWCRDITRFARPLPASFLKAYLIGELKKRNLTLWCADTGKVDFSKLETRIVQSLNDEIKNDALQQQLAQSVQSRNNKRDKGEVYVKADCLGFRSIGMGQIKVVESELETVRTIFSLYNSGKTIRQICIALTDTGHQPYKGGSIWNRRSICMIIKRPWYCGHQYASDLTTLIKSSVFPEIIPLQAWQQANNRLNGNGGTDNGKKESKYAHPLQGLIRCGYCGRLMSTFRTRLEGQQILRYYRCGNTDTQRAAINADCRTSAIRESMSEPALIDQGKGYLQDVNKVSDIAGLIECLYPLTISGYIRRLGQKDLTPELSQKQSEIKSSLQDLTNKLTTRYQDYEQGLIPRDVYASLSKQAQQQQDELQRELEDVNKAISAQASKSTLTVNDIDRLQDMSHRDYTSLIREVVEKVLVYSDKIVIILHPTENGDPRGYKLTIPRIITPRTKQLPRPEITFLKDGGTYKYDKTTKTTKALKPASDKLTSDITVLYRVPNLNIPDNVACHGVDIRVIQA